MSLRVQSAYELLFQRLVQARARVRWTDLRMTLAGYAEPHAARGIALSNVEL